LTFSDGSIGTIHYYTNGGSSFPKERVDVFCNNGVLQLDNFRKLVGFGWPGFRKESQWRQDKGHSACAQAFVDCVVTGNEPPITFEELIEVSSTAIDVAETARS